MKTETRCWVNVYRGQYADCIDGKPYYISPGYPTMRDALNALNSPKAKGIQNRYITTTKINFEIPMKTLNEHVQLFNTLEGATSFFTRTCISGGKSGRLLVLTNPTGKLDYVVDLTPKTKEQVHHVWPNKYTVLKTAVRYPSRVSESTKVVDLDDMNKGAIKVETLGDFVTIANYGTHMTMFLANGGKPLSVIVLEPSTVTALAKFLAENKTDNES